MMNEEIQALLTKPMSNTIHEPDLSPEIIGFLHLFLNNASVLLNNFLALLDPLKESMGRNQPTETKPPDPFTSEELARLKGLPLGELEYELRAAKVNRMSREKQATLEELVHQKKHKRTYPLNYYLRKIMMNEEIQALLTKPMSNTIHEPDLSPEIIGFLHLFLNNASVLLNNFLALLDPLKESMGRNQPTETKPPDPFTSEELARLKGLPLGELEYELRAAKVNRMSREKQATLEELVHQKWRVSKGLPAIRPANADAVYHNLGSRMDRKGVYRDGVLIYKTDLSASVRGPEFVPS